ncbi:MAG: OprO/OprP family phosphate-selective porin [Dysgonamonadaceae bacterium]|jgi:hypothetical protein|nr:OprO/OprP family phosphate-selective porin [Dysgonamonadaceae bacterium]
MKRIYTAIYAILLIASVSAQERESHKIFERLIWDDKMLNVMLDTRNDLRADFQDGDLTNASFGAQTIKLWFVGDIIPGVRYRLRHRLNKPQNPLREGYSAATDQAWIAFDAGEKWTFTIGKQSVQFGTFEYDYNPADVYVPTMCFDDLDAYKTGVNVAYKISKQTLNFQVINSDAPQFASSEYAQKAFAGLFLWEGDLFDGKLKTRWGYGAFQHNNDKFFSWTTIGTQLNLGKFTVEMDYYNGERYMDYGYVVNNDNLGLRHVQDQSVSLNMKYDFGKIKPFLKEVWNHRYDKDFGRNAYENMSIQAVIEYYPFTNQYTKDFRFHVMYAYGYTNFRGNFSDLSDQNNQSLLVGMRWLFKVK